ncbi:beta-glucosidase [Salix suchowensis]|nr:beta-glucosidase [Salix suchowensis]
MAVLFILILGLLASNVAIATTTPSREIRSLNRHSFPPGFIFGSASAAYQYEGAAFEEDKGPSIWDTFTHKSPDKISDHSTGDVAVDQYHRYKEDIKIMKDIGLDSYRFSISWPRILPKGKLSGGVNKQGIEYYNNLINELLANGLKPFVTLFHWDTPQALDDEYSSFLSPEIVKDFADYADICFREFGDRVKHWITLNEPNIFSQGGYAKGNAPNRCSAWQELNCTTGDSSTEPYLVGHNLIKSHAAAVKLYKAKYQKTQKGIIGITVASHWFVPYSTSIQDLDAAKRSLDFLYGWFMDPVVFGDYPRSMRSIVGRRLPKFTKEESMAVKGSFDFIGLNYYTAFYSSQLPAANITHPSYLTDSLATTRSDRNGVLIGPQTGSSWLHVYPKGFEKLLLYTKNKYKNPVIYITENGVSDVNNANLTLKQALHDTMRMDYYSRHLYFLKLAIEEGVKVKGYFAWSLLDNFEWKSGYTVRFGIVYIDYKDGLKRYPKLSARWFKNFLKK